MKAHKKQSTSKPHSKVAKPLKTTRHKVHSKRAAPKAKAVEQQNLPSQPAAVLTQFNTPITQAPLASFFLSRSFLPSRPLFVLGGGRSKKSEPIKKRFEEPTKAPKKELNQDEKDKKKLEKLEREKAKQATRQAQLAKSAERLKKEAQLTQKKQSMLQEHFQKAHLKLEEVDEKERAELEANAKRNAMEEEAERAARALRRATGSADV